MTKLIIPKLTWYQKLGYILLFLRVRELSPKSGRGTVDAVGLTAIWYYLKHRREEKCAAKQSKNKR